MRVVGLILVAVLAVACGRVVEGQPVPFRPLDVDRPLIAEYFEHSNAAARDGWAVQKRFLASTQHPDIEVGCDLGDLTVLLEPSLGTLRRDDDWRPDDGDTVPRGRVYVVAVLATVQRAGMTLATQVGSMHVVVLDGATYGFAPCPG